MKNILYFTLLLFVGLITVACDRDEDHDHNDDDTTKFDYRIDINSPSIEDKKVDDSIHVYVDFVSELTATVHHANVRIYNKSTGLEIYNAPGEAHVHADSGTFSWHDDLVLTEDIGIVEDNDYILEAKVWAHTAGLEEVVKQIEFHVHAK